MNVYTRAEGFGVGLGTGEGVDGVIGFVFGICVDVADAGVITAAQGFEITCIFFGDIQSAGIHGDIVFLCKIVAGGFNKCQFASVVLT